VWIQVESSDMDGLLIGRRGETLSSMEHLLSRMTSLHDRNRVKVVLDVGGYRSRKPGERPAGEEPPGFEEFEDAPEGVAAEGGAVAAQEGGEERDGRRRRRRGRRGRRPLTAEDLAEESASSARPAQEVDEFQGEVMDADAPAAAGREEAAAEPDSAELPDPFEEELKEMPIPAPEPFEDEEQVFGHGHRRERGERGGRGGRGRDRDRDRGGRGGRGRDRDRDRDRGPEIEMTPEVLAKIAESKRLEQELIARAQVGSAVPELPADDPNGPKLPTFRRSSGPKRRGYKPADS